MPAAWVLKLGGSLQHDDRLPQWLAFAAHALAGRAVVVAGGGRYADAVRAEQRTHGFGDLEAHNRAVGAMARMAAHYHRIEPRLALAAHAPAIREQLDAGRSALWTAQDALRDSADDTTTWDVTSDSLALLLARRLGAARVVVVKSCAVDAAASWADLSRAGVLDARFAALAHDAAPAIHVVARDELGRVRSLLADCGFA
jgi:5-(aminomethyl)-3-furanmethanol phosphate kinase